VNVPAVPTAGRLTTTSPVVGATVIVPSVFATDDTVGAGKLK